jgi:hypothetical protein
MNKFWYAALALIVLALIAARFFFGRGALAPAPQVSPASQAINAGVSAGAAAQTSAATAVDNANPFSADVNPASGYKNPFGQ